MNIGIITFHWAANHGAIMQTYALCKFLEKQYHANVKIIDYYPKHMEHTIYNSIKKLRPRAVLQSITEVKKNKRLRDFRSTLPLTKRYYSNSQLIDEDLDFDILITGSDQIWNPSFLRYGEKGGSAVYYLNFGKEGVRKLSVSASFGCKEFPKDCYDTVIPLLEQFTDISVRENTGINILRAMGIAKGAVAADPTSLLSREDYLDICRNVHVIPQNGVSKMILRKQSKANQDLIAQISSLHATEKIYDLVHLSLPEWLAAIRDSKLVITNSFHCVMMCLKLHTPFMVILEDGAGSGMNDRFTSLLNRFELTNRIVASIEDAKKVSMDIDYDLVDKQMQEYAETLKSFLERNIY